MMRKNGLGWLVAAAVVIVTFAPGRARGEARYAPGHVELRLSPIVANGGSGINGIEIVAPEGGGTRTEFGLNMGIGVLATPYIEPGASLTVDVVSAGGTTTDVGMTPFLKINTWAAPHVNPFVEPFAGFLLHNPPGTAANSTTYFDGGLFAGVDFLVHRWGIRLWSGFEALVTGNSHVFEIPVRWALVAYF